MNTHNRHRNQRVTRIAAGLSSAAVLALAAFITLHATTTRAYAQVSNQSTATTGTTNTTSMMSGTASSTGTGTNTGTTTSMTGTTTSTGTSMGTTTGMIGTTTNMTGTTTGGTVGTTTGMTGTTSTSTDGMATTSSATIAMLQTELAELQAILTILNNEIQALVGSTGMGGGTTGSSTPGTSGGAMIDQNNFSAGVGSSMDFSGRNFGREEVVNIMLNGSTIGTAHADGGGNFSTGSLQLPLTPGMYTYTFMGQSSGMSAKSVVTIH